MNQASRPISKLMIVDDNDVDQLVYRRMIEQSERVDEILSFHYASDALDYLKAHNGEGVDVILLDINMPRMNGFEFLDAATELFGNDFTIVIVMLTSSINPKDSKRARTYPVVRDYLGKPLTDDHLERIVELLQSL
ncbi:MAG: response regulator [Pseudomonadota bacterium]